MAAANVPKAGVTRSAVGFRALCRGDTQPYNSKSKKGDRSGNVQEGCEAAGQRGRAGAGPRSSQTPYRTMAPLQITTTFLGLGLAAVILVLVRRDHLYLLHGLFWILVAGAAGILGVWPGLIDHLAAVVGISYPPALLLLVAVVVVLVKTLHTDIVNTRVERDVRRLNQRLALLEADRAGASDNPARY